MEVKAISVVPLEEFIVVDECLLGFQQMANLTSNVKIEICFPIAENRPAEFITLKSPFDGIHFFDNQLQWGERFHCAGSDEVKDYKILCLLLKYYSDEAIDAMRIQTRAHMFISNMFIILETITPFSICQRINFDNRGNTRDFTISSFKSDDGLFNECALIYAPDRRGLWVLKNRLKSVVRELEIRLCKQLKIRQESAKIES